MPEAACDWSMHMPKTMTALSKTDTPNHPSDDKYTILHARTKRALLLCLHPSNATTRDA